MDSLIIYTRATRCEKCCLCREYGVELRDNKILRYLQVSESGHDLESDGIVYDCHEHDVTDRHGDEIDARIARGEIMEKLLDIERTSRFYREQRETVLKMIGMIDSYIAYPELR